MPCARKIEVMLCPGASWISRSAVIIEVARTYSRLSLKPPLMAMCIIVSSFVLKTAPPSGPGTFRIFGCNFFDPKNLSFQHVYIT